MKRGNSEKLDKSTIAVLSEYAPIEALAEYMGTMEEGMETVELTKDEAECVRWFKDDKCIGCFGASMNDCENCDEREARESEERMENVELTLEEAETLTDLIELYIFDIIRNDEDIDNINWLVNVMSIYEKCKYPGKGGDNEAE